VELKRRLLALLGVSAIVSVTLAILFFAGVLGNQGGGPGIEKVALLDPPRAAGQEDSGVGAEVRKLAPDFEVSDIEGKRHRLSDFRGKVVYVNFWATWCTPCIIEMPDIQELLDGNGDKLVVIGVNRGEPLDRAKSFLRNLPQKDGGKGVSFTVDGMDPDDTLYNRYRGLGMPVSVFIDAQGIVTFVRNGLIVLPQMQEALANASASGG
jgi:thiol-disulfide isomerase/thioredoxin